MSYGEPTSQRELSDAKAYSRQRVAMKRAEVSKKTELDTTRTPATQLEIAAHWLEEAAAAIRHDAALRLNLGRVAHECKAVAYREGK